MSVLEVALLVDAARKLDALPREQLALYQRRLLRRLCAHAQAMPFWARRLAPVIDAGGGLDLDRFGDIPVLRQADLAAAGADVFATALPAEAGPTTVFFIPGPSGGSLEVRRTGLEDVVDRAVRQRLYEENGFDGGGRLAQMVRDFEGRAPYPFGLDSGPWYLGRDDGTSQTLDALTPASDQAEWLARVAPDYLVVEDGVAFHLAAALGSSGVSGAVRHAVLVFGAPPTGATREKLANAYGARVLSVFAMPETGTIAFEGARGELIVAAEAFHVEVADETGRPLPPGFAGDVLVTSFYNYAMPLIRYRTGFRAMIDPRPSPTGSAVPRLLPIY